MVSPISAEPDIQRMGGKVSENHKLRLQPDGINNGNDTQASYVEDGNYNSCVQIDRA
jgi:hypothetical protein